MVNFSYGLVKFLSIIDLDFSVLREQGISVRKNTLSRRYS